jgi:purine-binding chemotaxis protein CheW
MSAVEKPKAETEEAFLTVTLDGQLCGLPARAVRDILSAQPVTRIPLAPPEVAGSLNLRGRIVTAIDLRRRLRLPPRPQAARHMSVVAEQAGELYALLVDDVSEVIDLRPSEMERNPATLPFNWTACSSGVFRLDGTLMVVLEADRLIAVPQGEGRAANAAEPG